MIAGDDDNRVVLQPVALERRQHPAHASVELPGAAVVERADLGYLGRRQGVPFGFQVGAADEGIDIEIHAIFVAAAVGGVAEEAAIWFLAAIRQMVTGKKHMPEKRPR